MTPVQTIRVVEDRFVEVEIPSETASELFTSPTDLFDVRPSARPGMYHLTAGGRIGRWETPSLHVIVESKIPGVNLLAMIDPEAAISSAGRMEPENVLSGLAARLGRLMARHAARGLRRAYIVRQEESGFLTGKLDVAAHARDPRPPVDHFHMERDSFSLDVPMNQFPKAVVERLRARFPNELAQGVSVYSSVTMASYELAPMVTPIGGLQPAEAEIVACAKMLWEGCGLTGPPIPDRVTLELLDLHRVFEEYVARELVARLPELDVKTQQSIALGISSTDRNIRLVGKPDVMIAKDDRTLLIADTKWKVLTWTPNPADVQQLIAYMHTAQSPMGMLAYPGVANARQEFDLLGGGTLIVQQVKVTGTVGECQAAMADFADSIRERLRSLEEQAPERRDGQRE